MDHTALTGQTIRPGRVIPLAHTLRQNYPTRNEGDFIHRFIQWHDPNRADMPGQLPGSSAAVDRIEMQLHVGTHVDSPLHIAFEGKLHDDTSLDASSPDALDAEINALSVIDPVIAPGLLLDLPKLLQVDSVDPTYHVSAELLDRWCRREQIDPRGKVVLLRTGRDADVGDRDRFLSVPCPGIDASAARWMAHRGVVVTGSDTFAFEAAPLPVPLEPHVELIFRSGIPIVECLNLQELARSGQHEFLFVMAPLPLSGTTASPVNPLAVLPE